MLADIFTLVTSRGAETGVGGVLRTLGPRTRTLALLLLVVESVFGASVFSAAVVSNLSTTGFVVSVIGLIVVLLAAVAAITAIELAVERNKGGPSAPLRPSEETASSDVLDALVNSTLQMMCRTASLPLAPDKSRMRAFIFRLEGAELVCRYYWALNPTSEKVGITRFPLTESAARKVAVVRCALDRKVTRTPVQPLSAGDGHVSPGSEVAEDVRFVLAAPIFDKDGKLWGTVDFDTSNEVGRKRLLTEESDVAIVQLTQHLRVILSMAVDEAEVAPG